MALLEGAEARERQIRDSLAGALQKEHAMAWAAYAGLDLAAIDPPVAEAARTQSGPVVTISTGLLDRLASLVVRAAAALAGNGEPRQQDLADIYGMAADAALVLYVHELGHVLCGHLDFPLPEAHPDSLRLVSHPIALAAARTAFEYEADLVAVDYALSSYGSIDEDGTGAHNLVAVMRTAAACFVATEIMERYVYRSDPAALTWSALGRFNETQVHPSLLTRRFLMLDRVVQRGETSDIRDALEQAWNHGIATATFVFGMAFQQTGGRPADALLGMPMLELAGDEAPDPGLYAVELEYRLDLLRQRGLLPVLELSPDQEVAE